MSGCPDCGSLSQCPTHHPASCRFAHPHRDALEGLGWWAISGDELLAMLRRVAAGEDPDLVYAEEYANSEHERPAASE